LINGDTTQIGIDKFTGFEIIQSGSGSDTLIGNAGFNTLFGNDGDDLLQGGGGKDELYGGGGSDTFVYKSFADSGLIITKRDVLHDFDGSDKIDLSAIDAMAGGTKNDAFTFIGGLSNLSTANANGALWFDNGVLYASNDFDVAAEFTLSLPTMTSLDTSYFIL
jgi:serralysin